MKIYSLVNSVDGTTFQYYASRAEAKAYKVSVKSRDLKIAAVEITTSRPGLAHALNVLVLGKNIPAETPAE